ncbi:hypothetical protein LCGC14_1245310 [marine sediment metagenome]|uniref:Lysozyme n=1 Tax=marine sediment metagenome TaxID=412755 RepID=A0A0F9L8I7_9ZZZZ
MSITGMIIRHEGLRLKPYLDSVGKLTIGVGRNLDDMGISKEEAMFLLRNDLKRVMTEARGSLPFYDELSIVRQDVILDMVFNLGITRFLGFKKMIRALKKENYKEASVEMKKSKWYQQVPNRAKELIKMMKTNKGVNNVC